MNAQTTPPPAKGFYSLRRLLPCLALFTLSLLPSAADEPPTGIAAEFELYPGRAKSRPTNTDPVGGQRNNGSGTGLTVLNTLTGVTAIRTEGSVGSSKGLSYLFANLRIASNQTTLNDYIVGTYTADLASQRLVPSSFRKYASVGLYAEEGRFLLKDNTAQINFYTNPATPAQFAGGAIHTWQSSTVYKANLSAGQSLGMVFGIPVGRTVRITLTDPCNEVVQDQRILIPGGADVLVFHGTPVFLTGTYQFVIEPVAPATAFSYQSLFTNENYSTAATVVSGNSLTASFPGYGRPYKKYKVSLTSGQTVSCPADFDTTISLINSDNEVLSKQTNTGLIQTVTKSGDYYIVISPGDVVSNSTETYSGVMTITNGISYLDWSWLYRLRNDRDAAGEDADGDGMTNLLEYALNSDPDDGSDRGVVSASVSAADLRLNFTAPNYVQGVTYAVEFSANGTAWPTAAITTTGTVDGGTLRQASVARSTGRRMGRLRVTTTPP
jgi:hypothetical protein